jgi:NHLM bacteriocin system ABC transporter peptidase/ATP-binding protein
MNQTECGAVSLGIMLAYFGRWVPSQELFGVCGVSRDGANLLNVKRAAEKYGLKATATKKSLEDIKKTKDPAIIYWGFNHFLVYEGYRWGRFYLNDPGTGPRSVGFDEFNRNYTGIHLKLETTAEFKKGGHRPSTVAWLLRRLRFSKTTLLFIFLVSLILVLPNLCQAVYNKIFYDEILGDQPFWLKPFITASVITILVQGFFTYLSGISTTRLQTKLAMTSSADFFMHCLKLPLGFFTGRLPGDLSARVNLNNTIAQLLSSQVTSNILNLFLIAIYGVLMLFYDTLLTCVAVTAVLCNSIAVLSVRRYRIDLSQQLMKDTAMQDNVAAGGVQIIETFKASGQEDLFFTRWADYQTKTINTSQRVAMFSSFLESLPAAITALSSALVFCIGGWHVIHGILTLGELMAFQTLFTFFITPVNGILTLTQSLQDIQADTNRLQDVLNEPKDTLLKKQEDASHLRIGFENTEQLCGSIELKNIYFGYNPLERALIEDFSLRIEPGAKIALVGKSGSGKTTVARLVAGLLLQRSGELLFDGQPQDKVPRDLLAKSITMVNQDIVLFSGTVRENLTTWNTEMKDEDLIRAARDAEIFDTIVSRPGGFDCVVEQLGQNFSGGQRQRLEIARALARNPSVLILDEATNALDTLTEKKIMDNIKRRNITLLISAHRLSTIRDCDEIIVFSDGIVVERGKHEELMKLNNFYTRLIEAE